MRKVGIPITIRIDESCLAIARNTVARSGEPLRGYLRRIVEWSLRGQPIYMRNITKQEAEALTKSLERTFGGAGRITEDVDYGAVYRGQADVVKHGGSYFKPEITEAK